ncbi:MFS transporter [Chitinimonas lacunae]|uniref:MFS transporter n=1 Tax=Chitinimonas lacunae TaxID=1963018 RepID=A0ABV8MLY3_9NEIS
MTVELTLVGASRQRSRTVALCFLFVLLGVIYASWSSRIPAVRDALRLDAATLGTVLLGGGIGAVVAFPFASWLVGHYGARNASLFSGLWLVGCLPLLAWMPNSLALMLGMLALGMGVSCFDVAINALGAEVERASERSMMSLLHAWFCVGSFGGALLGSGAAAIGLAPWLHFLLASTLLLPALLWACSALPCDRPEPQPGRKHFALPHGALVWLGAIAFLGAITEGSLGSWTTLYLRDHLHASEALAPLGYAFFSGAMLVARLLGDRLKDRFGARAVVAWGSLLAGGGLGLAVMATSVPVAIVGFVATGLGVAGVFPFVFSAAGREGSSALAAVATMGYSGSLIGPPVIGYIVHGFGLPAGIAFLALASVVAGVAAWQASLLRQA